MSRQKKQAEFCNGLNLIYSPPADQTAVANVVLIHGLFGHPWKTWADESVKTAEKPFWPKTFLPAAIPNARIYTFGYDADVSRFMSAAGLNTVSQHGTNLLSNLADLLDESESVCPLQCLPVISPGRGISRLAV